MNIQQEGQSYAMKPDNTAMNGTAVLFWHKANFQGYQGMRHIEQFVLLDFKRKTLLFSEIICMGNYHNSAHYLSACFLFETQLSSTP
jgi:hypothetical protein